MQDQGPCDSIEVYYNAPSQKVHVETCLGGNGWTQQGADIAATLVPGDIFGARAHADGTVEVFRNDALLATRTLGPWPFKDASGRIGVSCLGYTEGQLWDDFGGGTL